MTALLWTCTKGEDQVARIKGKANVNATDEDGYTALMFASHDHHLCAQVLVKAGADVNAQNNAQMIALALSESQKTLRIL